MVAPCRSRAGPVSGSRPTGAMPAGLARLHRARERDPGALVVPCGPPRDAWPSLLSCESRGVGCPRWSMHVSAHPPAGTAGHLLDGWSRDQPACSLSVRPATIADHGWAGPPSLKSGKHRESSRWTGTLGTSGSFAHSAGPEASGKTAGHTSWTVIRETSILSVYAWIPQNELQEGGELGAGNFQNCGSYAQRPCSGSASRCLRVRVVLAAV